MTRIIAISVTVLLLALGAVSYGVLGSADGPPPLSVVVQHGEFELFVRGEGSIVATRSVRITCPLSWRAITFIAPEGSQVKQGEVVMEFEREDLEEEVIEDENQHRTKFLKHIEMQQTLRAEEHRLKSEISTAEADLKIATLELGNLLKQPLPDDLKRAEIELRLANAVLAAAKAENERASNPKLRSLMLASEIRSVERRYEMAMKDHALAETTLRILKTGPKAFPDQVEQARLKVKQAEAELDRSRRELPEKLDQLTASIKRAKADVDMRVVILDGSKKELESAIITSPVDGMVIYRTVHGKKLTRGDKSHRGSGLIDLPELKSMSLRAKVRESDIQQVKIGSKCRIFIDAVPGKVFTGEVVEIGTVAQDSSATAMITIADMRRETGIKVFEVTISIDSGHELLRPNLIGRAEIIVEKFDDVVSMPIDAVYEEDGQKIAYLLNGSGHRAVPIKLGPRQDDRVIVKEGLAAGRKVCIVLPPETGIAAGIKEFFSGLSKDSDDDETAEPTAPGKPAVKPADKPSGKPGGRPGGMPGGRPGGRGSGGGRPATPGGRGR